MRDELQTRIEPLLIHNTVNVVGYRRLFGFLRPHISKKRQILMGIIKKRLVTISTLEIYST